MNTVHRWIEEIEDFIPLARQWDDALKRSGEENPFLLSDFILTWWKHSGRGKKLMILALYEEERLIGGVPLCLQKDIFRRTLSYIGGNAANLTHFLSVDPEEDLLARLFTALDERDDWDILKLDRVIADAPFLRRSKLPEVVDPERYVLRMRDAGLDGRIDLSHGYEGVLKSIDRRLNKYIRKGKLEAEKLGELRLQEVTGPAEVKNLFEEFKKMSAVSFAARGEASAFLNDSYAAFFKEILITFDRKNMLDADKLIAGKEILGISFGYRFGRDFKWILTAYNHRFGYLRPGHLLIDALVKKAAERGDRLFDMYYGGEKFYKMQWCDSSVPLVKLEILKNKPLNVFLSRIEDSARSRKGLVDLLRKARGLVTRAAKRR